jgi:hypothetical protein
MLRMSLNIPHEERKTVVPDQCFNNPWPAKFQIDLSHALWVTGGCLSLCVQWTSLWNCSVAESGVSSGSPSDLGHSEEECEKTRVSHRHSLPHVQHGGGGSSSSRWVSQWSVHELLMRCRTRRVKVWAGHVCTVALNLDVRTSLCKNSVFRL